MNYNAALSERLLRPNKNARKEYPTCTCVFVSMYGGCECDDIIGQKRHFLILALLKSPLIFFSLGDIFMVLRVGRSLISLWPPLSLPFFFSLSISPTSSKPHLSPIPTPPEKYLSIHLITNFHPGFLRFLVPVHTFTPLNAHTIDRILYFFSPHGDSKGASVY